jgi:hypothetical protein
MQELLGANFSYGTVAAFLIRHAKVLLFKLKKKRDNLSEILAPWESVCPRPVLARVRIAKGSLFAGLAFARVTILNIRKSNGVCCPGWSSESQ